MVTWYATGIGQLRATWWFIHGADCLIMTLEKYIQRARALSIHARGANRGYCSSFLITNINYFPLSPKRCSLLTLFS